MRRDGDLEAYGGIQRELCRGLEWNCVDGGVVTSSLVSRRSTIRLRS